MKIYRNSNQCVFLKVFFCFFCSFIHVFVRDFMNQEIETLFRTAKTRWKRTNLEPSKRKRKIEIKELKNELKKV